jgi:predicted small lipoprotein YifL
MDATSRAKVRTKRSAGGRIALLIMLGAMLAGCGKCGNLWSPWGSAAQSETQACRELPPQPR